jgi:hypothetical protein
MVSVHRGGALSRAELVARFPSILFDAADWAAALSRDDVTRRRLAVDLTQEPRVR